MVADISIGKARQTVASHSNSNEPERGATASGISTV